MITESSQGHGSIREAAKNEGGRGVETTNRGVQVQVVAKMFSVLSKNMLSKHILFQTKLF